MTYDEAKVIKSLGWTVLSKRELSTAEHALYREAELIIYRVENAQREGKS